MPTGQLGQHDRVKRIDTVIAPTVMFRLCCPSKSYDSAFGGLLTPPVATVEPDSAQEWHVRQTGHTIQREANVGWLAQVTTRFLGMLSWNRRGALCSPIQSSEITETIELVAAPNLRRHATR